MPRWMFLLLALVAVDAAETTCSCTGKSDQEWIDYGSGNAELAYTHCPWNGTLTVNETKWLGDAECPSGAVWTHQIRCKCSSSGVAQHGPSSSPVGFPQSHHVPHRRQCQVSSSSTEMGSRIPRRARQLQTILDVLVNNGAFIPCSGSFAARISVVALVK